MNKESFKTADYSSCLFRIPKNGGRVLWEITNKCNYSCKYCIFSSNSKSNPMELTTDEVLKTYSELKEKGFKYLKFSGGEPFIRKDMIQLLKQAEEEGFVSDISTNGSLITEKKARELSKVNLNLIHVSLDGHNAKIHESMRGNKTFYLTTRGIENLKKYTSHYIRLGSVIFKGNENHLEELVKKGIDLSADEIIFSKMEPIGRLDGDTKHTTSKTQNELETELEKLKSKYHKKIKINHSFNKNPKKNCSNCPAISKFLFIDNLGRVSPCTWLSEKDSSFLSSISLKDFSLDNVLNSSRIKKFYENLKKNEKGGKLGCPALKI